MANNKRGDNFKKKELSHWNFIVGIYNFIISIIFGKFSFKKLVSQNKQKSVYNFNNHKIYLGKNRKKLSNKFKIEVEHIFVFLLVMFFLGFMFLDYGMAGSEFFETNTTHWTGQFWRTQSDGENITLGNDTSTVLLLHFDGTNGSTSIVDSSNSGHFIQVNDNAQISTTQSKFGGSAYYSDGINDRLNLSNSNDFAFGTGDFTVDFWVRFTSTAVSQGLVGGYHTEAVRIQYNNPLGLYVYVAGATGFDFPWTPATNTWYHVSVVRTGNTLKSFIDGSQIGVDRDITGVSVPTPTMGWIIGDLVGYETSFELDGYMDEVRVSKGIARWTNNFSAPSRDYGNHVSEGNYTSSVLDAGSSARWENISWSEVNRVDNDTNTVLLLHLDGTNGSTSIVDSSNSGHFIQVNDNAQISTTQSKFGGSAYYSDGINDRLNLSNSNDFAFGTGDFTVDFWVRFTSTAVSQGLVGGYHTEAVRIQYHNPLGLYVYVAGATNYFDFPWTPATNTWYHVSVVRTGNTLKSFIDGSQIGVDRDVTGMSVPTPTMGWIIGDLVGYETSFELDGYMDEVRVSKGIARWTNNFSAPSRDYSGHTNISMEYRTSNDNTNWLSWTSVANGYGLLNDSARYFQYRAYLNTSDEDYTPYLMDVNVSYNIFSIATSLVLNSTSSEQLNYTNESLTGNFLCSDSDDTGDTLTYLLEWWKGNTNQTGLFETGSCLHNEQKTIELYYGNTSKTEIWVFNVTICNGGTCGSQVGSNLLTIRNYAPVWTEEITNSSSFNEDTSGNSIDANLSATGNGYCYDLDKEDADLTYTIQEETTAQVDCSITDEILSASGGANFTGTGYCTVRCSDGTANVDSAFQMTVNAVNDAPWILDEIKINSTDGSNLTNQDLSCCFTVIDVETDTYSMDINWLKNNVTNLTFTNEVVTRDAEAVFILESGNTTRNELWSCEVRPYDGSDYGNWINSTELEILNLAPYKPDLHLPENNSFHSLANNNISFTWMNSSDLDNDALTYWLYIDGEANHSVSENENTSLVMPSGIHNWSITVDDNQANTSSDVFFLTINTPPTTPVININSSDGYNLTNVSLFAFFTLIDDIDGNDLVYNISWLKNNITQFSFENISNSSMLMTGELTSENTTKGETWIASVIVCDIPYYDCGSEVNSTELTILNEEPTIPNLNLPDNNTYITNQTIFLVSNSSDLDNDNIQYYLEIDNDIDFSSVTYANTSIEETNNATELGKLTINDGTYWWRVLAYDDEENSSWSEIRNFTIDNTYPSIVLDNPVNGSSVNNNPAVEGSVTQINLTITDNNLDTVWWSNDSGLNNYSVFTGSYDINITDYTDTYLNITVWANDSADNIQEKEYSFIIDLAAPIFVWISPGANEVIHDGHIINLTATDALSSVDTLTVWYNGSAVNYTMSNDAGTEEYYYNWDTWGGDDGQYTIIVYGNDTANNLKEESRYVTVDNTAPTVILESPADGSTTNLTSLTFSFTPDDVHDIINCTLIINDEINETLSSITKGSSNSFTSIYLTNGTYNWNVNCTDEEDNQRGNETNFILIVNLVPLIDYIEAPGDNSYLNQNSTYLNFSVSDEDEDAFVINWNGTEYYFTNQTHEYNFTDLSEGNYTYYGMVNDTLNQTNITETRTITIDTIIPGEFNITSPENSSQTEDNSPSILWQQPAEENLANYTIEFSNQSDFGHINATYYSSTNSFSDYTALDNATWYLRIIANDLAGNSRSSDSEFTVAGAGTITETVTVTTTVSGGGGGTSKKPYSLDLIAPPTVTLYSDDEITIPLVIRNNAKDINLNNINLAVTSDSGEILGFLDITNIGQLLPGKEYIVNLKLITGALRLLRGEGNFGLTITANVANPSFTDSIKIFANVIDVNSENRTTTYEEVRAAYKLFEGNPECMDLVELLVQADEALANNEFDKAYSLAKGAVAACSELAGLPMEVSRLRLPFGIYLPDIKSLNISKDALIISVEVIGLGIVLIGLIRYLRVRRGRGKKNKSKLEAEHVFVFFGVMFFLGFMFLDYGLAGSVYHNTSSDWTGTFWQTQTDGENITLLNQSAGNTNFFSEGNYTHSLDVGQNARWENISWSEINTTALDNISIEYRTSQDNTNWDNWIGVSNGYGELNDSAKYFQYRVYLTTNDTAITPYLQNINITYNLVPLLDYIEVPANNSYVIGNSTYLNFSVSDEDEDTFVINWNGTEYYFTNQTHEYNFTELDDGNYTYYGWVNDTLNQTDYTDIMELVIDTTQPSEFNITNPENSSQTDDKSPVLTWQQPAEENFANYTIEFSNQSDFGHINATYYSSTNSFSDYTALDNATWYLRIIANDLAGNSRSSDSEFTVAAVNLITETVTVTTTVSGGGGGTSKKPYALNIIAPPTVTLYSNDEITIPLVIKNSAKDINLNNINLAVTSDSGEILGFLDITNIGQLLPGKEYIVNLKLITGALKLLRGEGNFGLTITANVANPKYMDSIQIFANVIDVNSENRSAVYDALAAAHNLFDGNPGCKDLEELLIQADESLEKDQIDKALSLARGAVSACKDLIGLRSEDIGRRVRLPFGIYLPFDIKDPLKSFEEIPKDALIIGVEVIGLGIVLIGLIRYLRVRRLKGKKGSAGLFLLFLLAVNNNHKKRSFDEIRFRMLKTLSKNKKQTMNELAVNSGLCWRTVKTHIIYLKGKGWAREILSTPYVRIFEITENGEEESKRLPEI